VKIPLPAAFVLAMAGTALLGMVAERLVFRPLRQTDPLTPMISAIGLSFLLQNVLLQVGGAEPHRLPSFASGAVFIGSIVLPLQYIVILGLTAALIIAIELYLRLT